MCHWTYSAVKTFVTTGSDKSISVDNKTFAGIIADTIDIRDRMNCDRMTHNDAYGITMYLATI